MADKNRLNWLAKVQKARAAMCKSDPPPFNSIRHEGFEDLNAADESLQSEYCPDEDSHHAPKIIIAKAYSSSSHVTPHLPSENEPR